MLEVYLEAEIKSDVVSAINRATAQLLLSPIESNTRGNRRGPDRCLNQTDVFCDTWSCMGCPFSDA